MNALWTSPSLEAATLGTASAPFVAGGVTLHSRKLEAGDLYVAVKGEKHDGHDFVADALAHGAVAAVVSRRPEGLAEDAPLLSVAHTQRALEDIGVAGRNRFAGKVTAVTGSVGKTTAKELLRLALGACGKVHASSGSLNNHWGVPLTLAQMPPAADFAVIEVGMNHFGEIRTLNSFVRPDLALITAIAPAHIAFFGNLEAIADAKSEIFAGLVPGGTAILPADDARFDRLAARAAQAGVSDVLSFGRTGDGRILSYTEEDGGAAVAAEILGRPAAFRLGAPGLHNALGAVAALVVVAAVGGDVAAAAAALADFSALKGRGARFFVAGVDVIDECYNANPTSMAAALSLLKSAPGRKIAVLGDMLELGAAADALHAGLVDAVKACGADAAYLCGEHMRALWDELPAALRGGYAADSATLAPLVAAAAAPGDTILVKGSNGSRMTAVVDALKARREG
jgi:UDP-N-acetylmuramoyl-tripeptide--D-alanyl-D-alanine ligase